MNMEESTKKRPRSIVVRLTHLLMQTFNDINDKYYANNGAVVKPSIPKDTSMAPVTDDVDAVMTDSTSPSPTVDTDCNYLYRLGEVLNNRYQIEKPLGRGSFGRVVLCRDLRTETKCAVKIIKAKPAFLKQSKIEIEILQTLSQYSESANIVACIDTFRYRDHQCIVFELLSINLYDLLRNTRFKGLSLGLIAKFAKQLLHTLHFLSSSPISDSTKGTIIHCDLKPENILLRSDRNSGIKVIDFGSACYLSHKPYSYIQSRFYRAPEILMSLPYSSAIDMWSLGCILMELRTGHPLFDGSNESEQIIKQYSILGLPPFDMVQNSKKAQKFFDVDGDSKSCRLKRKYAARYGSKAYRTSEIGLIMSLGSKYIRSAPCDQFLHLVSRMLTYKPSDRITPQQALQHPFFDCNFKQAVFSDQSSCAMDTTSTNTQNGVTNHLNQTDRMDCNMQGSDIQQATILTEVSGVSEAPPLKAIESETDIAENTSPYTSIPHTSHVSPSSSVSPSQEPTILNKLISPMSRSECFQDNNSAMQISDVGSMIRSEYVTGSNETFGNPYLNADHVGVLTRSRVQRSNYDMSKSDQEKSIDTIFSEIQTRSKSHKCNDTAVDFEPAVKLEHPNFHKVSDRSTRRNNRIHVQTKRPTMQSEMLQNLESPHVGQPFRRTRSLSRNRQNLRSNSSKSLNSSPSKGHNIQYNYDKIKSAEHMEELLTPFTRSHKSHLQKTLQYNQLASGDFVVSHTMSSFRNMADCVSQRTRSHATK